MRETKRSFCSGRGIICFGMMFWSMVIIFMLSNQSGKESAELSDRVADWLQIEMGAGFKRLSSVPLFWGLNLRAYAHVVMYACFGIVVYIALGCVFKKQAKRIMAAIVFCLIFSCLDEYHQMFIPGRSMQVKDLMLDAVGYLNTIAICAIMHVVRKLHFYIGKVQQPVS